VDRLIPPCDGRCNCA